MNKSNLISKSRRLLVSSITLLLFCAIVSAQETVTVPKSVVFYPDTIIYNGKIVTMDDTTLGLNTPIGRVVQAMAVRDRKIEAVGNNEEILAMAGPRTDKVDVKGRMVMPGIIDTHDHIHNGIQSGWLGRHPDVVESVASQYSVSGNSEAALPGLITAAVKEHVRKEPAGRLAFIKISGVPTGRSLGHAFLQDKKFTRQMLDLIAPNHPIILLGAAPPAPYVINSATLKLIKEFFGRDGGLFSLASAQIDDSGVVMGSAPQYTRALVGDIYFRTRVPQLADILEEGLAQQAALGITTYASHLQGLRLTNALNILTRNDRMPIRFGYTHWHGFAFGNPNPADFYKRMGDMAGMGDDYLWQTGVGLGNTDDGPPVICTTMEAPRLVKEKREMCLNFPGSVQDQVTRVGIANYLRVLGTHSYGDKAVDYYMDAVEGGMKDNPGITLDYIRSLRLSVDHCGFQPRISQLPRMAKLGLMISCGTRVLSHSYPFLGSGPDQYPMHYVKQIAPIRSAIEAGVMPTLELDGTGGIENNTSQTYFYSAVPFLTRKNQYGNDVSPEEAVDRNTLMKMMTSWPARFMMKEKVLGTLEKGKFADFLVLSGDYFTTPVDKLADVIPLMAVVGGKVIVLREEFAKELGRSAVGPQLKFDNVAKYLSAE